MLSQGDAGARAASWVGCWASWAATMLVSVNGWPTTVGLSDMKWIELRLVRLERLVTERHRATLFGCRPKRLAQLAAGANLI
jgi:hypothetical protein